MNETSMHCDLVPTIRGATVQDLQRPREIDGCANQPASHSVLGYEMVACQSLPFRLALHPIFAFIFFPHLVVYFEWRGPDVTGVALGFGIWCKSYVRSESK